jgi:arsenate reductase (thioredoxin)
MHHVLILCTGNSARSILAEAIINHRGAGRFVAHSAGSFPKGTVHPLALALLGELGWPTADLRSKSWDEFAAPGAPAHDLVITVCDNAAGEFCPIWPGKPVTAHWGIADPAAAHGSEAQLRAAFRKTFNEVAERVDALLALPSVQRGEIPTATELRAIGRESSGSTAQ